ncbi:hypothetical protein [Bradyrhizobium sp. DASA03007]|uniref:hypothetical protein n=1 Tax=unclassified Bradyrhizobium TaxID=2631580 RepID=UPI003F72B402
MAGRKNNSADNRAKLDKIYDVFDKHNVPVDKDAIWEVQGTPVVKHKDVERLGAAMGIEYEKPQIIRAEADEAVIMVVGRFNGKMEWSIGEAKIMQMVDTGRKNNWGKPVREPKDGTFGNYIVTGGQAAYPWAMAEKRAKDRVILKLADLHGDAYSSEEADDFKKVNADDDRSDRRDDRRDDHRDDRRDQASNDNKRDNGGDGGKTATEQRIEDLIVSCETKIRNCKTIKDVTDLMNSKDIKDAMAEMSKDEVADLRGFATDKLHDLGWKKPEKEAANG